MLGPHSARMLPRHPAIQVLALEAVDRTVGQIVRRLWEAESCQHPPAPSAASRGADSNADGASDIDETEPPHFTLVIAGGSTTPVMSGRRSHEPVPFTIAHLRHVVSGWPFEVEAYMHGPVDVRT